MIASKGKVTAMGQTYISYAKVEKFEIRLGLKRDSFLVIFSIIQRVTLISQNGSLVLWAADGTSITLPKNGLEYGSDLLYSILE